jgi:hypothetical protein
MVPPIYCKRFEGRRFEGARGLLDIIPNCKLFADLIVEWLESQSMAPPTFQFGNSYEARNDFIGCISITATRGLRCLERIKS